MNLNAEVDLAERTRHFTVEIARCQYAKSFFSHASRLCNSVSDFFFLVNFDIRKFKLNVNRHLSS